MPEGSDRTAQPFLILSSNTCLGTPGSFSQLLYPTWLCSDVQFHLQTLPLSLQIQQLLADTLLLRLPSPLSSLGATTISLPSKRQHHPSQKATAKTVLLSPLLSPCSASLFSQTLVQGYPCLRLCSLSLTYPPLLTCYQNHGNSRRDFGSQLVKTGITSRFGHLSS